MRYETSHPDETVALGRTLGATMRPLTVGLTGALGAGKTHFARGVVAGVAPDLADWVSSPTYAICNVYPSHPPVHHFDLYRLSDADDLEGVGFREADDGWRLVEWVDRIDEALDAADVVVRFERGAGDRRVLAFEARTDAGRTALQALASAT